MVNGGEKRNNKNKKEKIEEKISLELLSFLISPFFSLENGLNLFFFFEKETTIEKNPRIHLPLSLSWLLKLNRKESKNSFVKSWFPRISFLLSLLKLANKRFIAFPSSSLGKQVNYFRFFSFTAKRITEKRLKADGIIFERTNSLGVGDISTNDRRKIGVCSNLRQI